MAEKLPQFPQQEEISLPPENNTKQPPSFVSPELVQIFANSKKRKRRRSSGTNRRNRQSNKKKKTIHKEEINQGESTNKERTVSIKIQTLEGKLDSKFDEFVQKSKPILFPQISLKPQIE